MPKIPFVAEVPEFKPRSHIGQDEGLTKFQKDILEALDILEQRGEWSMRMSIKSWNGVLLIGTILILALIANLPVGALVVSSIKHWLAP